MQKIILMPIIFVIFFSGFAPSHPAFAEFILPIEVKEYQGISYISGGIGSDERKALLQTGKAYSLKIMFAVKGGAYLADVKVVIKNPAGKKLFEGVSEGPWMFIKLRPGKYQVSAVADGKVLNKAANVNENGQTEIRFYWKN
ncbi:MAG: carboxypeptidase regulatory-like domain-containing protein [Deltaproteobacteria bacterium]|nr:carboxypeptidase regulatory-like domain-containing protein [Deltaproteobacteria bacterium]